LTLATNAFVGGDYLEDLEALREDVAIQRVIGREDLPDPSFIITLPCRLAFFFPIQ
jgi:hypothetical protein